MYNRLIILIIIFTLLTGCKKDPIKVGFAGSLSGDSYEVGIASKNGFEIAVDNINENGGINGRKILPVIKDDASNLETSYKIIDEFAEEGVKFIIGFTISSMKPAIEKGMNDYDMLFISPTISTIELENIDDNFLRISGTFNHEILKLIDLFAFKYQSNNIAVVYDLSNETYTKSYYNLFKDKFEEHGGSIAYTGIFSNGDKDYSKVASEIIHSNPDSLMIITNSIDASGVLQQLTKQNFSVPTAVCGWAATQDLIKRCGLSAENVYSVSDKDEVNLNKEFYDFTEKYKNRFLELPSFSSYSTYDSLMVFAEGFRNNSFLSVVSVKDKILETQTYHGLQAKFKINNYGDSERRKYLLQIVDGKFVVSFE